MASENSSYQVIIAGAGPVGLFTALRLGQENIRTLVLEGHHQLLRTTRAMVYMPVINHCVEQLGLTELLQQHAYLNRAGVSWRNMNSNRLAHLPLPADTDGKFCGSYQIGQARMNDLLLEEILKYSCVEVKFGTRVVGIEDDKKNDVVRVMAHQGELPFEDVFFEAKYVLGTDGSNSAVRKLSCIPFSGYTFDDFKMVGTDILFDVEKELGWTSLNFIVDPEDWAVIAYTGQDGAPGTDDKRPQWRVAFVEPVGLPDSKEETHKRAMRRTARYLRGRGDFELVRAELYWLHQRCAAQASKGRVFLAGDALYSNNPIGGLGLTSGILDAYVYGNAFTRVIKYGEPASVLADAGNSRRNAWLDATSQFALGNLRRLKDTEGEHAEARKVFFDNINNDPDFPRQFRNDMDRMIPDTFEERGKPADLTRLRELGGSSSKEGRGAADDATDDAKYAKNSRDDENGRDDKNGGIRIVW
ncbi:FAD/NAD(P)-binding domain-containing protein [Trichoderma velutinum]